MRIGKRPEGRCAIAPAAVAGARTPDHARVLEPQRRAGNRATTALLARVFSRAQALRKLGGRREEAIALFERCLDTGHGERDADARGLIAELRGPRPTGDGEADLAEAKQTFEKGAKAYDAKRYMVAADAFADAHALAHRPQLAFSRAQALRRAGGHAEEAIALYEADAASGGERAADAKAFAEVLRTQGAAP